MTDNFRLDIVGAIHYSKSGHDSNPGTKAAPRKSIGSGNGAKNVIGTGIYIGNFGSGINHEFYADGKVINITTQIPTRYGDFQGIEFRGNPVAYLDGSYNNFNTAVDCVFKNINGTSTGKSFSSANSCLFISCDLLGNVNQLLDNSIHINTQISCSRLRSCYVDPDSKVSFSGGISSFSHCNIQGVIILESNQYAIQDDFTGTPQDNGYAVGVKWLTEANLTADGYSGTISGWDAASATCINKDPLFNDASISDYSLQAGSPMVGKALDGISNIGGTEVALSYKVDQNGVGTVEVIPSAEIDTANPTNWILSDGETEGYIDFIMKLSDQAVTLNQPFEPLSDLNFDSDYTGGTAQNRDVVDSHPKSSDYPTIATTTGAAGDDTTVIISGNSIPVGNYIRVAGEVREIIANDGTNITVASAFRANVGSGVNVRHGTVNQIAALNPNRLTYELRTSTQNAKPAQDSEWDNGLNPIYNKSGVRFTQEWSGIPLLIIDGNEVYGGGDTDRPSGISGSQIQATWINVRVYLRNDYKS